MSGVALASTIRYSGRRKGVCWCGRHVADRRRFSHYLREIVRPRVADAESGFEADLRGLATTGMATEYVERLLRAAPAPAGWEIGEALAECALATDTGREIHWPWNTVRDRRTPRASLPGSDLVGFCKIQEEAWLLFGEVKTSSEAKAPPNVMYGGSGMTWQLQASARRLDVQRTLLQWLHGRCASEPYRTLYEQAVRRFLSSSGKELLIVGVLIRDTEPQEADLRSRASTLSEQLASPTLVELYAWYLPIPIREWATLLREAAP